MVTKELAGCVIYDEQGRLLLLHRNTARLTQWELPGGKVETALGESAADAAMREVLEEASVHVELIRNLGSASFLHDGINWNYTWFEATIVNGVLAIGEPDTFDQMSYFHPKDLKKRNDISPNLVNLMKVIE